jgi:hypothetical protein
VLLLTIRRLRLLQRHLAGCVLGVPPLLLVRRGRLLVVVLLLLTIGRLLLPQVAVRLLLLLLLFPLLHGLLRWFLLLALHVRLAQQLLRCHAPQEYQQRHTLGG